MLIDQSEKVTDWDIEVLKEAAGLPSEVKGWGAAVGASLEFLCAKGYMVRTGAITKVGREYLNNYLKSATPAPGHSQR